MPPLQGTPLAGRASVGYGGEPDFIVCAAARAKSLFPSSRVVHLNRKRIGLDKRTQPRNSDGMHEPTTLSFRSALKGPISNYLSSVASRSYASTEPLPISWAPSFPTPGMSPALPSFTSLTVITRSSDAKKSFLLALTVHPSSARAFSACSRILSSSTTPTSTSSIKRAVPWPTSTLLRSKPPAGPGRPRAGQCVEHCP